MFSDDDARFMHLALKEARKGAGRTSPNPCVGAVIVKDGKVVGTGYHKKAGTDHAEIHALGSAGMAAQGAVMYVTLEPCNHQGRTAPCSPAVAAAGIAKVVIGMLDPNPLVDGGGFAYLRQQGIEVHHGLLAEECRELNRPFLKFISTGRPLVIMKAALTLDGKITFRQGVGDTITGGESLRQAHRLRNTSDAIMVGIGTVAIDNPSLTTRISGRKGRDPLRIILDTSLRIDENAQVITQYSEASTWIFCSQSADPQKADRLQKAGVCIHRVATMENGRLNLPEVLRVLGNNQITSLLVEGGASVHGALLNERLVDCVNLFYAPVFGGEGGLSVISGHRVPGDRRQAVHLENVRQRRYGNDLMLSGDVVYPWQDLEKER